jgi:DNA-directed RNA polymerase beta' subunit
MLNNLDDIQYQIDIVEKDMEIEEAKMNSLLEREKSTRNEYQRYMDILKENPDLNSIDEYIENSAENLASDALIQKNEAAIAERQRNNSKIDENNAEIRKLDKGRRILLASIEKDILSSF